MYRLLRKLLRLPAAERWLLVKAALLLETIKLGMRLLPFRTLWPARVPKPRDAGHPSADRIAWAVEVASRYTPGVKTCLTQALAAQVLLARRGHPVLLRIGVCRGKGGRFQAHAWVESEEGEAIIGGSELERYTQLAIL